MWIVRERERKKGKGRVKNGTRKGIRRSKGRLGGEERMTIEVIGRRTRIG